MVGGSPKKIQTEFEEVKKRNRERTAAEFALANKLINNKINHEQYEHEKLLLSEEMLELRHPDDGHQWLLELQLRGGAAGWGGNLPEADIGASMALLEELEEVVSTL